MHPLQCKAHSAQAGFHTASDRPVIPAEAEMHPLQRRAHPAQAGTSHGVRPTRHRGGGNASPAVQSTSTQAGFHTASDRPVIPAEAGIHPLRCRTRPARSYTGLQTGPSFPRKRESISCGVEHIPHRPAFHKMAERAVVPAEAGIHPLRRRAHPAQAGTSHGVRPIRHSRGGGNPSPAA